MALLPSSKEARKHLTAENIKITDDVKTNIAGKKSMSKKRRPIQVDADVLQKFHGVAYAMDIPMYEVARLAIAALQHTLTEAELERYDVKLKK